jgi:hypothetical protein
MDGLDRLCRECDRVFHKAVTKRTHIRVPFVVQSSSIDTLLTSLDMDSRQLVSLMQEKNFGPFRHSWTLEYLMNSLCVLLHYTKALVDDRRVILLSDLNNV